MKIKWSLSFTLLLLFALAAHAQFTYRTNNGAITITGYNGTNNDVVIPSVIDGLPVTSIGTNAFYGSRLANVIIPDSVTNIGDYAFFLCWSLSVVTIPSSVISIGDGAFSGCSLTSINLPSSVTKIGDSALVGCWNLATITVDSANQNYSSNGGVLFDKDQRTLIQYPFAKSASYIIPDNVTSIGGHAFYECTGLTNVTIPHSVTSIGDSAFGYCTRLTSVSIPNSVTSIADYAFSDCTSLTSLSIPNTVTSIGEGAFYDCTSLTNVTISPNLTSIPDFAFEGCVGLISVSVTLSNSIASIGERAFLFCSSLTSFSIPDSVTSIGERAFSDCTSLASVMIPNSLTSIGDWAFSGSGVTIVTIPNSVTSIGVGAFYYCFNLTNVTVDSANQKYSSIGGVLFDKGQTTLIQYPPAKTGASYLISDTVTSIGDYAFSFCNNLLGVTIPNNVTNIVYAAFEDCINLIGIYFQGNAPSLEEGPVFSNDYYATAYYLPGTTGWGTNYGGLPTTLWAPLILNNTPGFGVQSNGFGFTVSWAANLAVVVEASPTLSNPSWSPLATNNLVGGSFYFSDPQWTKYPSRFYRVRSH